MSPVVEEFKSLERIIYSMLSKHGFKKKKSKFQRHNDEIVIVVGLQRSRSSTASSIKFTINASIYVRKLLDSDYDDIESLSDYGGHCYWRIGNMLSPNQDLWWRIEDTTDPTQTFNEVLSSVSDTMLPFLATFSSVSAVLLLWRSGFCPGRSEKQRLDYLSALKTTE